jgi:hypothetical protein
MALLNSIRSMPGSLLAGGNAAAVFSKSVVHEVSEAVNANVMDSANAMAIALATRDEILVMIGSLMPQGYSVHETRAIGRNP